MLQKYCENITKNVVGKLGKNKDFVDLGRL